MARHQRPQQVEIVAATGLQSTRVMAGIEREIGPAPNPEACPGA
jgi:hypothetical protein